MSGPVHDGKNLTSLCHEDSLQFDWYRFADALLFKQSTALSTWMLQCVNTFSQMAEFTFIMKQSSSLLCVTYRWTETNGTSLSALLLLLILLLGFCLPPTCSCTILFTLQWIPSASLAWLTCCLLHMYMYTSVVCCRLKHKCFSCSRFFLLSFYPFL